MLPVLVHSSFPVVDDRSQRPFIDRITTRCSSKDIQCLELGSSNEQSEKKPVIVSPVYLTARVLVNLCISRVLVTVYLFHRDVVKLQFCTLLRSTVATRHTCSFQINSVLANRLLLCRPSTPHFFPFLPCH
ncbi:hypothetical protein TGMAS_414210 [Toxoplasma gondii MAS]|uniref:Uncharacterized protein n=1 Tax=Toxoplasma gondii MAS TaxID=943118 RepID=A0A086QQ02_TOXGO|nr:hypothetical protein TGMAS_414210 [Toxoplasma gondii MAS]